MKKRKNLSTKANNLFRPAYIFLLLAFLIILPQAVSAAAPPTNLILNPSVEQGQSGTNNPKFWNISHSAKNQARFYYPVSGNDGQKAVRVQVSKYIAGEESWFANRIKIGPNQKFTFTDSYKSTVKSYILVRFLLSDKTTVDLGWREVPVATKWSRAEVSFTSPAKTVGVTIYHALKSTGTLTTDKYSLIRSDKAVSVRKATPKAVSAKMSIAGTTTVAPHVSFFGPVVSGSGLFGEIPVEAIPLELIGQKKVASVQFFLDGKSINNEMTGPPYIWYWKTQTAANGPHEIVAIVRDVAGNVGESVVQVSVNNSAPTPIIKTPFSVIISSSGDNMSAAQSTAVAVSDTTSTDTNATSTDTNATSTDDTNATSTEATTTNLILNPTLEISNKAGAPDYWRYAIWGNNEATFNYPATGTGVSRGINITIDKYTDGDAKWYFDDVIVTPGDTYTYSDKYKSSTSTDVVVRFLLTDNTYQYVDIGRVPASADWREFSNTIYIPQGVLSLTVFHLLQDVGSLTMDDFSLVLNSQTAIIFDQGYVSLSFDDGWASQYDQARPILEQAGLKGTFYIITDEIANAAPFNMIPNPNLLSADGLSTPEFWHSTSYGNNDAEFAYGLTGYNGDISGAKVTIKNYQDGDAKWYSDDIEVIPGQSYLFSDKYLSSASTSTIEARFTLNGTSTYRYITLGHPAPGPSWQSFTGTVVAPPDAKSVSIYHSLESAGELTVDQFDLEAQHDYMNASQLSSLQAAGNEIGAHTMTHPAMSSLTASQLKNEVEGSKNALIGYGLTPINSFAYPEGFYDDQLVAITKAAGFKSARTVDPGYNLKTTDPYLLETQGLGSSTTFSEVKFWIDTAVKNKIWQPLVFHQIDHSGLDYSTTPELFQEIVNYIKEKNVPVITISEGVNMLAK